MAGPRRESVLTLGVGLQVMFQPLACPSADITMSVFGAHTRCRLGGVLSADPAPVCPPALRAASVQLQTSRPASGTALTASYGLHAELAAHSLGLHLL